MKRNTTRLIGVLVLGTCIGYSQIYINSWENDLEGWTVVNSGNFASAGFVTSPGVVAGTYSWAVTNYTGNYLWNQDGTAPDLEGPSSTALTALLANGGSVDVHVTLNDGGFGWGIGFSLYVSQPGGAGILPISRWENWLGGVRSAALRFTIPAEVRSAMKAYPNLPSSLRLCTGGGGRGTMYLDGLRVTPFGQANSWEADLEGWTVVNSANFASDGFSSSTGVTAGLYSWIVRNTTGNYKWNQDGTDPDLESASSVELTSLLANATNVTLDVVVPSGSLGWGIGFSLYVNQPGGAGILPISKWENWMGSGSTNTLVFPVSQDVRTALLNNPNRPSSLRLCTGGGGPGVMYFDNLRVNQRPPVQASLWVRELWDDMITEQIPANVPVTNNSSSVGFDHTSPWVVNPAQVRNCRLMAFRPGFYNEPKAGDNTMGLPGTLNGSWGCLVQQNNGFSFFPTGDQGTFWSDGIFMTRQLKPECYINFQAVGEYWFSMIIANGSSSPYAQYVTFPASGWGGFGFADGSTTNGNFVAIGVTGFDVYLGPTNTSPYHGDINVSKTLYISQGTLGQPGDPNTAIYNPLIDPNPDPPQPSPPYNEYYSQTNFSGGPYRIRAYATNSVGLLNGDYIVLLGRLRTHGDGTATVDAKWYGAGLGGNPWNTELDINPASITWDCSYSFSFGGTMTKLLLFQNGQFPFYIFGLRAGTNFTHVVGFDPGRIHVAPLANTYVGYPINMTNLAVAANAYSWSTPPAGYGTLTYQWYKNNIPIPNATNRYLNIPSATITDAGTYMCVATDPSGTWGSVTNYATITVTDLGNPRLMSIQMARNRNTFILTFDQANLAGVGNTNNYVFDNGIVISNLTVIDKGTNTEVQLRTSLLPLGTKISLTVSGITNVVGKTLGTTNVAMWTDLIQTGVVNWDGWLYPALVSQSDYFNNFIPANPWPPILQSMSLTAFDAPSEGITIVGMNGYTADGFGGKVYGWFIPPVTTNYVFFIACDDGGRLWLSTNESPDNLRVIACESLWSGPNQWTNICDMYPGPGTPHRGDGTANGPTPYQGYVWDNSIAGQSPATACLQNRSDQFIVAFYNSTELPGGPPQATNANWRTAPSQVYDCVPHSMTNLLWPQRDQYGQALIRLEAGKMYYMELEHMEIGGGQNAAVTYKIAGEPDPLSPSPTIMRGGVIAGTVPFRPTISIAQTPTGPVIYYTGVLLAGPTLHSITNVVAQSSAATAISLGGPSQYRPPLTNSVMFYRTRE
ncbi:MAG: immunoglobulin domain-containing protein [Verrucomicrobiae bacterium]|nr:immunoglobulin domain-containing protein [Verrucomicrobiae bacterium]